MEYYGVRTIDGLYHHGILGQKWGVMNGPPYPLGAGEHSPSERKHMRGGDTGPASLSKRKKDSASDTSKVVRKNISNSESDKNKNQNGNNLDFSKLRSSLTRAYISEGHTRQEAEEMARRNEMATKIALGVAVGALAAGTAYAVYRTGSNPYKDFVIGTGASIQRISAFSDPTVRYQFYGALDKADKIHYRGRLSVFRKLQGAGDIYQHEMKVQSDIKVAGIDTCKKVFEEMKANDQTFARNIRDNFGDLDYKNFDRTMVANGNDVERAFMGSENPFNQFHEKLKEKGYGAMIDYNDAQGAGFKTNRPIIFFGQESNISVDKVSKLDDKEIARAFGGYKVMAAGKKFADVRLNKGIYILGGTSVAGSNYVTARLSDQNIINTYREEHPNSNLSNQKILDNYLKNHRSSKKG